MIDKNLEVKVTNRSGGGVGYTIQELGGLRRQFQPKETKTLTYDELEKLSWIPGGKYLLEHELVVHNEEVVKALLGDVEPEYYYSDAEVKYLLQYGTYEQLLDCLDFAPAGVLEMIKQYAVELPCNDVAKRDAIYQKLGFNVTRAIEILATEETEEEAAQNTTRRTAPVNKSNEASDKEKPARRYTTVKK